MQGIASSVMAGHVTAIHDLSTGGQGKPWMPAMNPGHDGGGDPEGLWKGLALHLSPPRRWITFSRAGRIALSAIAMAVRERRCTHRFAP
jgi:hypothetical protein